jgi:subfamily B ATP-binding cassette protein MsbA
MILSKHSNWHNIRRLLTYSKRYTRRIVTAMVASLCVAGSDVTFAKLVQPFVDHLLVKPDATLINLVPLIVIGLSVFKAVGRYVQNYFIKTAGQLVVQDLRNDLYCHYVGLSMKFYAQTPVGSVMSRVLNDVGTLQRSSSDDIVDLVRESMTLIGLIGLVFYTDLKLAFVAFLVLPLSIVPASIIGRRIKNYTRRGLSAMGVITGVLQETLAGIKLVKAFGTENIERERFRQENWNFYKTLRKVLKYDAAARPVVELLSALGGAAVLWFGISRVVSGDLSQGEFSTFLAAMMMMFGPVRNLTKINANLQRSFSATERIFEVLDVPYDVVERHDAVELENVRGEVCFEHVHFAYQDKPVLVDFTVTANPGEVIALVGPSGAGKSTVAGLLARFYDPQQGRVILDGHDLRDLSLRSLRASLAFVDQETVLFNASIADNIRYGTPDATEEQVIQAARLAYADEFIRELDHGYDSKIGDRGLMLSGGQRQRICIARAILRNAPILVLDEATSALDTESEMIVQEALSNLMRNRTTFVIAHRLSTVMHADKIVVLEQGKIVEIGRHQELLVRNGLYRRLYTMQFKDD